MDMVDTMAEDKVKLTKEDKERFAEASKTANPVEWLTIAGFLEEHKDRIPKEDWKFMWSQLGRRGARLLKNVVRNFSFED